MLSMFRDKLCRTWAVTALFGLVLAVPNPTSLGSDLQILLHNDVYGMVDL